VKGDERESRLQKQRKIIGNYDRERKMKGQRLQERRSINPQEMGAKAETNYRDIEKIKREL
jgi:hypothetical protein